MTVKSNAYEHTLVLFIHTEPVYTLFLHLHIVMIMVVVLFFIFAFEHTHSNRPCSINYTMLLFLSFLISTASSDIIPSRHSNTVSLTQTHYISFSPSTDTISRFSSSSSRIISPGIPFLPGDLYGDNESPGRLPPPLA